MEPRITLNTPEPPIRGPHFLYFFTAMAIGFLATVALAVGVFLLLKVVS